ncbi:MAG: DUF429 domain-containing protein [Candidatus Kapaibacteriota bacterium]
MGYTTEYKVVGLDLAGKENNFSGICILDGNSAKVNLLKSDKDIVEFIIKSNPDAIGIDAPLSLGDRICDRLMKKYGAMPTKLKGIFELAKRAINLTKCLKNNSNATIIEVFPTATAKILGFYKKNIDEKISSSMETLKIIMASKINKDEFDAFLCALTTNLYLTGFTQSIGDDNGSIVIPDVQKVDEILKEIRKAEIRITKYNE